MHAFLPNPDARYSRAVQLCAAASAAIGAIVLFGGWGLQVAFLRNPVPGYTDMKANTAAGLLLAGTALWCGRAKALRVPLPHGRGSVRAPRSMQSREGERAGLRLLSVICAAIVLLIGSLILLEDVSGRNLGID